MYIYIYIYIYITYIYMYVYTNSRICIMYLYIYMDSYICVSICTYLGLCGEQVLNPWGLWVTTAERNRNFLNYPQLKAARNPAGTVSLCSRSLDSGRVQGLGTTKSPSAISAGSGCRVSFRCDL